MADESLAVPFDSPHFSISRAANTPADKNIYIVDLHAPPENRITLSVAQDWVRAYRHVEALIVNGASGGPAPFAHGAIITTSSTPKFFTYGLCPSTLHSNSMLADGFVPLLATLLDLRVPTIALISGHAFGAGVPIALAHDYRVMNVRRGYMCMPPVELGLHFDGLGTLLRAKLAPNVARATLLEARRWTGPEALANGIVDRAVEPDKLFGEGVELAMSVADKARMGVYALLREELWGEATRAFRLISYKSGREVRGWAPGLGGGKANI
ncbi:ClpP/crotonase-like domain-containing protein [Phyllosticta citrichinensis]|uniref:ClpP/crotonase-like domain-containing protein n=1 Tax=Phyllosticta citrichinensis TaxID=1130410 RepID=A0ABR1XGV4_9PEZI